jgi:hypothetical protein
MLADGLALADGSRVSTPSTVVMSASDTVILAML